MSKKTLFMETTSIDPEKTAGDIQQCLREHGAEAIMTEFDPNGQLKAIQFRVAVGGQAIHYQLPCRWEAILKLLKEKKKSRYYSHHRPTADSLEIKARRIAWRQILRWTEAQLALVRTGMADSKEVFLPYALNANGQTLYQVFRDEGLKAIGYEPERPETLKLSKQS